MRWVNTLQSLLLQCGFTPLMVAIYHKSSTVVDVLLRHQPRVDAMAVGVCICFNPYIVSFCKSITLN